MTKKRLDSLSYIRAVAMLGVIGIHTGAYQLSNPLANIHLFALLEIASRFSVPIFFFVSGFGLFYNLDLNKPLSYGRFMQRRLRTVLAPYLTWSLLYLLHYTLAYGDASPWRPPLFFKYLLFGLASYHLYFLVILLWFYPLTPLWAAILRRLGPRFLAALLLAQIAFNYYSSYILRPDFASHYVNILVEYRLNYWVLHYIFIFLCGAYIAVHYDACMEALRRRRRAVGAFFALTLAGMLASYYGLILTRRYTLEEAANTVHQLSPCGVLYTLAASLFLLSFFTFTPLSGRPRRWLGLFGAYSYGIYLVHPFVMYYLTEFIASQGRLMTSFVTIAFFAAATLISLLISILIARVSRRLPLIGFLLNGSPLARK